MTRLTLYDLTTEYTPGVPAVADLNLTIPDGELLALLGPSGCGKTTTLRLIAGLLNPTKGDLLFDERSVLAVPAEKRGAVMVFQEHALFPFKSIGENIAFGLKVKRIDRHTIRKRVAEALALVQLPGFEERWPEQLSGGQRQRAALARALVVRPKVLLLDEPLSNLETELREEMRAMIRSLVKEVGITTIFVTHDQTEAVAVADRIALLLSGKLRQVGHPRDFYERPVDVEVARFFGWSNFIPGTKQGSIVKTPLGKLITHHADYPDGEVIAAIRPESIQIGANGYNNLAGRVKTYSFRGSAAHCEALINNVALHIVAHPSKSYSEGDSIALHLPGEHIHLLPHQKDA
jgi:ABC-type Fe3+/spermidine/putrescine transport system ATPase subunit